MREIAPGLWYWTAAHPAWAPGAEPESAGDWPEQVGSVLFEAPDAVVFIDAQVPDELWPALDERVAGRPVVVLTTIRWHGRSRDAVIERYSGAKIRHDAPMPAGVEAIPVEGFGETIYWLPGPRALVPGDRLIGDGAGGARVCPAGWLGDMPATAGLEDAARGAAAAARAAGRAPAAVALGAGGRRRARGARRRAQEISPSRWAFCTASARLRTPSLRYSDEVCSLIVCGERNSRSAISRLVAPPATRSSTSRSRSVSGGPLGDSCGLNTVMPSPTIRTAPAMSAAGQSLEMKPAAPAARAALGEIRPAPEISSTFTVGHEEAQALADLRARLLPDEQVDERDVRLVAVRERDRLLAVARAQAALDPRLLAEHQAEAPVHDLVVVDDEHAQALVAAAAGGEPAGVDVRHAQAAPPVALARCRVRVRRTR